MYLKTLQATDFKNFGVLKIDLLPGINCLTGKNGSGKTNILDAIHYLCFCKSFINPIDQQNVRHERQEAVVRGEFFFETVNESVFCSFRHGRRKVVKRNGKDYERLADHIGLIPLVIISPEDNAIVAGGSEERRRLMDTIISQFDKIYLDNLLKYNKALEHRNKLLKKNNGILHPGTLEIISGQMVAPAEYIFEKRSTFIREIQPYFDEYYRYLCNSEQVTVEYFSQLEQSDLADLFSRSAEKDHALQFTSCGTHKDDLIFKIDGYPVKRFGSQGQQKSFIIALKLSLHKYLFLRKKIKPLLLLDDIFAKLDSDRTNRLVQVISNHASGTGENNNSFGQIVITDTGKEHFPELVSAVNEPVRIIGLNNGDTQTINDTISKEEVHAIG